MCATRYQPPRGSHWLGPLLCPLGDGSGEQPIEIEEEDPEDEFGFGGVEELPLFATDEARELHAEIQKHKDQLEGHGDEVVEQKKRCRTDRP